MDFFSTIAHIRHSLYIYNHILLGFNRRKRQNKGSIYICPLILQISANDGGSLVVWYIYYTSLALSHLALGENVRNAEKYLSWMWRSLENFSAGNFLVFW